MNYAGIKILMLIVALLLCASPAGAMERINIEEELRLLEQGGTLPKRIPFAKFRVAVFTYEDPDGTGLGNYLAGLIGNHILLNSRVSSLGVLRYEGKLSPTRHNRLSYFDKVDRLIEAQEVSLAVWGMIRKVGENLIIDTYTQIPQKINEEYFAWKFKLPEKMGGATLQAHLRPNRIHLQQLSISARSAEGIVEAIGQLNVLRKSPDSGAEVVGRLPTGQVYWVTGRRGDWAEFNTSSGLTGWAPIVGNCNAECRFLLNAAQFASNLLAYMQNRSKTPQVMAGLSTDTLAVTEQIQALDALNGNLRQIREISLTLAARWTGPARQIGQDPTTKIDRGKGIPPGGAAFANLWTLAQMAYSLQEGYERQIPDNQHLFQDDPSRARRLIYENLRISKSAVEAMASDLAKASLLDPKNIDILRNLAVLFEYTGQTEKSMLARSLVQRIQDSN